MSGALSASDVDARDKRGHDEPLHCWRSGLLLVPVQPVEIGHPRERGTEPVLPFRNELFALAQDADADHVERLRALARRGGVDRGAAARAERLQAGMAAFRRGLEVSRRRSGHLERRTGNGNVDAERGSRAGLTIGAVADRGFLRIGLRFDGDVAAVACAVDFHAFAPVSPAATCGGVNARTAGAGASQRSISTSAVSALVPCASGEVPMSSVSTLGLPWRSGAPAASDGSNHAPVAITTTPGITPSSMRAPARQAPRSLNTRTTSPSRMPRRAASCGLMRIVSPSLTLLPRDTGPGSIWLCRRLAGWCVTRWIGQRRALALPSHSAGGSQVGWGGQSA